MATILQNIAAYKRDEVAEAKRLVPLHELELKARKAEPVRPFAAALKERIARGGYGLIAEIKKSSPSRGMIRSDFDPPRLAKAYENGGAACLSVLTDAPSFDGRPEYLSAARSATGLPVLRKDFMIDPYQVVEARNWGADCILIIMAMVSIQQAGELEAAACEWGMDSLVEIHDESELERALELKSAFLGINNRDLKTFKTTLETTERLAPGVPDDCLLVSESGLKTPHDLHRLGEVGVSAFLIGESLMRRDDVEAATRDLLRGDKTVIATERPEPRRCPAAN